MHNIGWYKTGVGEQEAAAIRKAILKGRVSMGEITEEFESLLAKALDVPYCLVTPSGSVALFIALKAVGVSHRDEVIIPNRGWVAAAHAVMLTGAKVVLADVKSDTPLIDIQEIRRKTTSRTKAIVPLHLNGRSVDMPALLSFAHQRGLKVVEDACQALFSRNKKKFIGTSGDIGCFSLGMAKLVATGQGGFAVTKNEKLYGQLKLLRNHGVKDNFTEAWGQWGFNFKFTDVQAAMGLAQLKKVPQRIKHLKLIYKKYDKALSSMCGIRMIPVDLERGEIPLYIEVLADRRNALVEYLNKRAIQVRPATPDLDSTPYLKSSGEFPNSRIFNQKGMYLPCGPQQPLRNIDSVIAALQEFERYA